jgi:arylsulfatase A
MSAASLAWSAEPRRPNIVYVLADDLGWGDLGCYNPKSDIPTPNADRLASQGMRFTDMHSPSAVCTPTRYGIMTGRYSWRSRLKEGVLWGYSPNLIEQGRLTVPALLKKRGYYTAGVGKWHLGLRMDEKCDYDKPLHPGPLDHGFDEYFGIPASLDMEPYVYVEGDRVAQAPTSSTPGSSKPRGVFWRGGPMAPSFDFPEVLPTLTDRAVKIIKERSAKSQPYFLYFPLTGPHTPWLPKKEYQGRSKAGIYGDFVNQVDDTLGRVLRAIEEGGKANNTLIIFTSDNGADWKIEDKKLFAHRANADWRGEKADIWDGGHRIPFLARWPGVIRAGSVSDELGCLTDMMATAAEIVGTKLARDAGEDSYSLLPVLEGKKLSKPIREAVVHHSIDGMFSIRQGEWKLELGLGSGGFSPPKREKQVPGGPAGQLYNIARDPGEQENLWLKRPEIVKRLTMLLEQYQRQGYSRPM